MEAVIFIATGSACLLFATEVIKIEVGKYLVNRKK
jgi:hypothetical protein